MCVVHLWSSTVSSLLPSLSLIPAWNIFSVKLVSIGKCTCFLYLYCLLVIVVWLLIAQTCYSIVLWAGLSKKGQNCCPLRKTRIIVALKSCSGWIVAFCCNTYFAKSWRLIFKVYFHCHYKSHLLCVNCIWQTAFSFEGSSVPFLQLKPVNHVCSNLLKSERKCKMPGMVN